MRKFKKFKKCKIVKKMRIFANLKTKITIKLPKFRKDCKNVKL